MSKEEVLQVIKEHPNITYGELKKIIGKNHFNSAQVYALVKSGEIKRNISERKKMWILDVVKHE